MTTGDLAGWFTTAIGKVEFYWNFYVVTLLALIGWMLSLAGPPGVGVKWLVTVGYLVFVLMNVLGLWNSYRFAEALRQDLLRMVSPSELENTRAVLKESLFRGRRLSLVVIHGLLAIIVLGCVWNVPFGAPLLAERSTEPIDEFAAIERGLAKAWVDRDEKAIDRLLAPDWTVIDVSGHVLTKAEVMRQAFGSQERQIESGVIDEVKVRRLKDVAIVTGRSVVTGTYRGTRGTVTLRFTDVFELREGGWQIVASQGTRIAE